MAKNGPLTVTDDFDDTFTIFGGHYSGNYGILTLSLMSFAFYREGEPQNLSAEIQFSVDVSLPGATYRLFYKTRKSAKKTYDILMKAAQRVEE